MRSVALAAPSAKAADPAVYAGAFTEAFRDLFALQGAETTEIVFVRHAEPDYRATARKGDPLDPPLTERGRCQTMRLAQRLRGMDIDAVYTSTMRRALETATVIAAAKDLPMVRTPQLRDIAVDARALNGRAGDPQKLAAELVLRFLNNPRWDAMKGLEPSRQFRYRVVQAVEGITAHHPGKRVVLVTHAGVINAYFSTVLDIARDMFFLPEHSSISVLRVLRDLCAVQNLNDFSHLLPTFSPR